jgi:hypothetical protein
MRGWHIAYRTLRNAHFEKNILVLFMGLRVDLLRQLYDGLKVDIDLFFLHIAETIRIQQHAITSTTALVLTRGASASPGSAIRITLVFATLGLRQVARVDGGAGLRESTTLPHDRMPFAFLIRALVIRDPLGIFKI